MNPDDFADDIMSNAPVSDCSTLSCLFSADDVFANRVHLTWCRQQKRRDTYGRKLHRAWFVRKMLLQFLRWLWTSFSSQKTKIFYCSSTSQHSKWLGVCWRDYDVTSLPTNSYVLAWLSLNHWCVFCRLFRAFLCTFFMRFRNAFLLSVNVLS